MNNKYIKPELLSPAGDTERASFALSYGADAIYLGSTQFGMRASPKNFDERSLEAAVALAHSMGKKVYLTLNSTPTNTEIAQLPQFLQSIKDIKLDAFIVADIGVLSLVKKHCPKSEIHLSTQVGIMNYEAARAGYELGAQRVVLARELSFEEIAEIRAKTPTELQLEAFVHGAMCMSFSGRCLLSKYMTGRDANRGGCAQPCRWEWQLSEKSRVGKEYDIISSDEGSYIMNADDLCMAQHIDKFIKAGVSSLKIEGRAKSFYYVASVTAAYRKAIDSYSPDNDYICPEFAINELGKTSHRSYSTGFYLGDQGATQNTTTSNYVREYELLAVVDSCENGRAYCTQRGKMLQSDEVEALTPTGELVHFTANELLDEKMQSIESTPHSMQLFSLAVPKELPKLSIIRKKSL